MIALRLLAACALGLVGGCSVTGEVTPTCPAPLTDWYHPKTGRYAMGDPAEIDIRIDGSQIILNETAVSETTLRGYVGLLPRMSPNIPIVFDPSGAESCALATRLRDKIDAAMECRENRCWQGTHAEFNAAKLQAGEIEAPW